MITSKHLCKVLDIRLKSKVESNMRQQPVVKAYPEPVDTPFKFPGEIVTARSDISIDPRVTAPQSIIIYLSINGRGHAESIRP